MKVYECPNCNSASNSATWDEKTKEVLSISEIASIEKEKDESFYYCPVCEDKIDGYSILEYEGKEKVIVRITKSEYEELLEIKNKYEDLCR